MPMCNCCWNEVPSSIKDYKCDYCGLFICTSCYYTYQGYCYYCSTGESAETQIQQSEITETQPQDYQTSQIETVPTQDASQNEDVSDDILGAIGELKDIAEDLTLTGVKRTEAAPLTPSDPPLTPTAPQPSVQIWDVEETQPEQPLNPQDYVQTQPIESEEEAMARIRGGQDYDQENYQTSRPLANEDEMMDRIRGGQDYISEKFPEKRTNLNYDEDSIRSQQEDVGTQYKSRDQQVEAWGVGGPPDQGDVVPEKYQTDRTIEDEEEMMRRIREGPQDVVPGASHGSRGNLDFDEDAIRSQQQDVVPQYRSRSQEVEAWGVGGPPDQGDVVPEKYQTRRTVESEEDIMRKIREGTQDVIPEHLRGKRKDLDFDADKIRTMQGDVVPQYKKRAPQDTEHLSPGLLSQEDYIPENIKEKRKEIAVDMHEIRMQQESFIPEEVKQQRKKYEVDMQAIRDAQESYYPEELKEKRRKLEVDMEKIRNQTGIKPEELKRKRNQYMVDMQKIRSAQESYVPQELKEQKKKLEVDMASIRDSVDDYIPDELKARKKSLEVDMHKIREAAQDYIPENVRRIRYQYSGDARNRAQDFVPEEYKGVKRERAKADGPSFLKHGTKKQVVAEDDGLLKTKPYSKEDLEREAKKARETAKDVVPEHLEKIKYEFDEESIRKAEDYIPEEVKKRKIKRGKPRIKSGYTYERIDSELKDKWERDGAVVTDKSKIKKVKYELKDDARDSAKDVIPEDTKKIEYEFDADAIRKADDVIPEDIHKVKYELDDSARDSAADFIPEDVVSLKRDRKKVTGPTFKEVDKKLQGIDGVSDFKKPEAKSYFDELEKKAKDGETLVSRIDDEGKIASSFALKEKSKVDVAKLSEALRTKAKDPSLLSEKPFEGRNKQKQQQQKADQLEVFMFLTFLGKLVFHPTLIEDKLL